MRRDPRLLAVPVVLIVVGAVSWAAATRPAAGKTASAMSAAVPITQSTVVCPQAGGKPAKGVAQIAYANADSTPAGASASSITAAPLDPNGVAAAVPVHAGQAWAVDGPKTAGPIAVTLKGPIATSSGVVQLTHQKVGNTAQASAAPCEAPVTDAWFAGFSSGVGQHATLLLSNIDSVPATVDVGIYGDTSPPNADADHDIPVAPQTQVAIQLDSLAPGLSNIVAHVSATAGRIVPAVRYDAANGSIPLGTDFLPRTEGPATVQTIPGIVGGDGARRLVLADIGDVDATVSVKVIDSDGSFTPSGLDVVSVPAGQVATVDLAAVVHGNDAAVVVTSTQPVVAGAVAALPNDKAGGSDIAFSGAVPALTGPAMAAAGESGGNNHTKLLLTAPDADAQVRLTVVPSASASPLVSPLTVPGGTTTTVDLGSLTRDPAPAVEVTPVGGGPVYAAWVLQEASKTTADITMFPLRSPPQSLLRPPVLTNPFAGLPGTGTATPSAPASPPATGEPVPSSEPPAPDLSSSQFPSSPPSSSQPSP
jgi:hypothetical protein